MLFRWYLFFRIEINRKRLITLDEMGSKELVLIFVDFYASLCGVLDMQFGLHRDFLSSHKIQNFLLIIKCWNFSKVINNMSAKPRSSPLDKSKYNYSVF